MQLAILLHGMFRHPDTVVFWASMLPVGDVFVFATYTPSPATTRSHDGPVDANVTFRGITTARYWSVVDQDAYDSSIGLTALTRGLPDPWGSAGNVSLRNAVRTLLQLESLRALFLAHRAAYTHILLSRVDLMFTRRVEAHSFSSSVVVPDYAFYEGENDRFVAGPIADVLPLLSRVHVWRRTGRLSEPLMADTLRAHNVTYHRQSVGYSRRVRVGGRLHDVQYVKNERCPLDSVSNIAHAVVRLDLSRCR